MSFSFRVFLKIGRDADPPTLETTNAPPVGRGVR
ncbi:MAG: hypothetical protein ACJASC_001864 [Limimaricola cinnabarinus]|jgi:hypothetical protein